MRGMDVNRVGIASLVAALALGAAAGADQLRSDRADAQALAAQARTIAQLRTELDAMRASGPDWAAVAAQVEPSVVTVTTDEDLGSGWVAHADASGSDIVTNYHVVAAAIKNGETDIEVTQLDRTMAADLIRTDRLDDLALLHVTAKLRPLVVAARRPRIGAAVLDLGSPLGLSGSVSAGVVSAYRSIFGSDYLQFTAPISPGNSGGPVVDGRGRVVGIATAKIVDDGAEGLGFAIPVEIACAAMVDCVQA
jgi:S1-C subfamily serine protease